MVSVNIPNHFYVTLFSNASRDIYEQNTHTNFTVKLAQPVDLVSKSNWEIGVCEISCSVQHIGKTPALIDCNLIWPQFLGGQNRPLYADGRSSSLQQHYVSMSFETCIMCPSNSRDFRTFESSL